MPRTFLAFVLVVATPGAARPPMVRLASAAMPFASSSSRDDASLAGDVLSAAHLAAAFGTVTSMLRSVEHNRAVGGMPNSYHLRGRAIDVVRLRGVSHERLDAMLRAAGYHLVESLDEGDHSHFAFAASGSSAALIARLPPHDAAMSQAAAVTLPAIAPPVHRVAADEHGTLEPVSVVAVAEAYSPGGGRVSR